MTSAEKKSRTLVYAEDQTEDGGPLWLVRDVLSDGGHEVVHFGTTEAALGHIGLIARGDAPVPDAFLLDFAIDGPGAAQNGNTVHQAVMDTLNEQTIGYDVPVIGMSSEPWPGEHPDKLYADVTKDGIIAELPDVIASLPDRPEATVDLTAQVALPHNVSQER